MEFLKPSAGSGKQVSQRCLGQKKMTKSRSCQVDDLQKSKFKKRKHTKNLFETCNKPSFIMDHVGFGWIWYLFSSLTQLHCIGAIQRITPRSLPKDDQRFTVQHVTVHHSKGNKAQFLRLLFCMTRFRRRWEGIWPHEIIFHRHLDFPEIAGDFPEPSNATEIRFFFWSVREVGSNNLTREVWEGSEKKILT